MGLLDVADALQHVGDVVDAPLLHRQLLHHLVQVHRLVGAPLHQLDELLR